MYSGLKHKKKICKGCGYPKYIFSHGLCKDCYNKVNFKPLHRSKIKVNEKSISDNKVSLSQQEAFLRSFKFWNGKNFLTGEKEKWEELGHECFHHILRKGKFKYFKYYAKNIIILNFDQHYIITFGKAIEQIRWIEQHPEEDWKKLDKLFEELTAEYQEWIQYHKNEYKLI